MAEEADIDRPITLQQVGEAGEETSLETTPRALMEVLGVQESDPDYDDIVAFFAGGPDDDDEEGE